MSIQEISANIGVQDHHGLCGPRFVYICWLWFLCVMKYRDQGRQQLWQPLYYLTPSFLSSHFLFHSNVIYPLLLSIFSLYSLPERRHMQSQVNTLICGRNLSHPLLSFSLSPHSLCRSSWLTPLCFKSRIPAQLLYLEPSHVHCCVRESVFNSVQAKKL